MQSQVIQMRNQIRPSDMRSLQSFRVKVHQPGEIPWMTKNPSSWEKIAAHEEQMTTVTLSLKGEKVDNLVRK